MRPLFGPGLSYLMASCLDMVYLHFLLLGLPECCHLHKQGGQSALVGELIKCTYRAQDAQQVIMETQLSAVC